jgi:hypothetical protein
MNKYASDRCGYMVLGTRVLLLLLLQGTELKKKLYTHRKWAV